jgi:2',3'-cyclic-nucleotide 2'-phosphodiesterase (5'-nucleotidase family)
VTVSQAGDLGRLLGRIRVPLRREGERYRVGRIEGNWLPVDESLPESPRIAELLERYEAPLRTRVCTSEFVIPHPASGDSPMGRLAAEVLRSAVGTDVALLARSTVRGGLDPGPVTVADLCRVHPWRSRVIRLTLTGSQIQHALSERDILTSGCRFRRTVHGIEGLEINGSAADTAGSYSVATDEFYAYRSAFLKHIPFDETGHRLDLLLYRYLRRHSVVRAIPPPDPGWE